MNTSNKNQIQYSKSPLSILMLAIAFILITGFSLNATNINTNNIDLNGDGTINILVLGTNSSLNGAEAFSSDQITQELQSILSADNAISLNINVVAEDIHMSKAVTIGLGGGGTEYTWTHHSHSLTQYYYWPEGLDARMDNLSGNGAVDWDYVVIGADPHIISTTPGYYSLGVNKIAAKVTEGGAQPLLLMMWPKNSSSVATVEHFEEFTYRTADGAKVPVSTIPAGLAWDALPAAKQDVSSSHPSPNGAYVAAASIYSHLCGSNASASTYVYDDAIADIALSTVTNEVSQVHYTGDRTFVSPFFGCEIDEATLNYNHTGSSSERGIKNGLQWVINQTPETLQNGGTSPINFNYGRANSNFEANKRYNIAPASFNFSLGFPMQDHGNHGNVSLLYGLDRRQSGTTNDTDLGVARFMVEQSELPYARAIPVRTLFAQMKEASPSISAYSDSWHMHGDLDKAIGAYMYTLLTNKFSVGEEPTDQTSSAWRTWMAHKIGNETAWTLMHLEGEAPSAVLPVELLSFSGENEKSTNQLYWATANEVNNEGFHVERKMENEEWEAVGFVGGKGTSRTVNHYSFLDKRPIVGINYYRLRQVDFDGAFDYSKTLAIAVKGKKTSFKVFPNPVPAGVNSIQIELESGSTGLLEVFDVQGRKIFTQEITARGEQISVDLTNLSEGIYFLNLRTGGEIFTERLVINKRNFQKGTQFYK